MTSEQQHPVKNRTNLLLSVVAVIVAVSAAACAVGIWKMKAGQESAAREARFEACRDRAGANMSGDFDSYVRISVSCAESTK